MNKFKVGDYVKVDSSYPTINVRGRENLWKQKHYIVEICKLDRVYGYNIGEYSYLLGRKVIHDQDAEGNWWSWDIDNSPDKSYLKPALDLSPYYLEYE